MNSTPSSGNSPEAPSPERSFFRFENLLVALVRAEVDFAVVGGVAISIFTRMRGRSLEDFRPRLRFLETQGVRIPYISPQDLIYLKKDSCRDKDKLDVLAMQEIVRRESQAAGQTPG